jgi:predicted Zn-dependent protease
LLADGIERDPRNVTLHTWTSLILLEVGRPRDAIGAAGEALRREPLNVEALAALAMAQASSGAVDEAALALARAEQLAPDHPRVREARQKVHPR